jgi:hypothetical protein
MNVNLVEFFSVQMASGLDSEIFLSFEEAQKAARVHDAHLSGAIYTHPKWTANASMWFDHPDFHKVRWGNPALERAKSLPSLR